MEQEREKNEEDRTILVRPYVWGKKSDRSPVEKRPGENWIEYQNRIAELNEVSEPYKDDR